MRNWLHTLLDLPNHPMRVFTICIAIVLLNLLLDGTAFRLWSLSEREQELISQIEETKVKSNVIDQKIKQTHDPKYLEREARERFDLVYKDDLVFIFSE